MQPPSHPKTIAWRIWRMPLTVFVFLISSAPLRGQSDNGELRITIQDKAGLAVPGQIQLISQSNDYRQTLRAGDEGTVAFKRLPHGLFTLQATQPGFAPVSRRVEISSQLPLHLRIVLEVAALNTSVNVIAAETLIDPHPSGSVNRIGQDSIDHAPSALPGRSVVDLVNSQPGWLYEGNAVLHPRGSEYATQFVIDGVPLTDNRSPSFGVEMDADDIQSMSVYTAGFPAEFGRKLGGVVDLNTAKDTREGFHGTVAAGGGSFDTGSGYVLGQYTWGANSLEFSGDGARTDRYLSPPVVQNYTNGGTTNDYSLRYERDLGERDRISFLVRHGVSRFEIPNEQVQQAAGQRQDRGILETLGIVSYQHTFTPDILADFRGMVRTDSQSLWSNSLATPLIASQDRGFSEGYLKETVSIDKKRNKWKAGFEVDSTHIHEAFGDTITDFTQFDPDTPPTFQFRSQRWDLEQSGFVQDQIDLGKWTVNAGLRWDHYQLLVNRNAVSPRIGVARYFQRANLVFHASYDRVFQTPFFENILISSSAAVTSLNANFLRLPVQPSLGNYYEAGFAKGFAGKVKIGVNGFDRRMNNFLDDDQLLNTAVSFPITFAKAQLYGAEAKLDLVHLGHLSGSLSYSYMVGSAYFPVTGGLFLGGDVANALSGVGRFWDSQDQRNTVRSRFRYEMTKRLWAAIGGEYGSGLPVDFVGTEEDALAQYGKQVLDRVNLVHGRVSPSLSIDASLGVDLVKKDAVGMQFQFDVENLNNRLNVIDFAGLFSGNAIGPPRSFSARLKLKF
jgi:TonB-dependent Receptor Plug Domain